MIRALRIQPFINPEVAETYKGTQSPGDVWTWSLDKEQGHMTATWDFGTFDDVTDDIFIEGTFEALPSGFLKVTIINSQPASTEIPTDGSAWFYAIEIPDMAMVIKPEGSIKGDVIAMVAQGDCDQIPGEYNYIKTAPGQGDAYNALTEEAFGYIELFEAGADFSISGTKFSLDCLNEGPCTESGAINGIPALTCVENGTVVVSEDAITIAQGQFTNAGVMMMDFGSGNGGVFALKADNTVSKESLKDNTYNGIAYLPKNNDSKTMPVQLKFFENELGSINGTGHPFTDLENGVINNEEGIVIVIQDVINGRVSGHANFDNDSDVSEMAAALLMNGNNQILILSSYDEESTDPFILILAKQN